MHAISLWNEPKCVCNTATASVSHLFWICENFAFSKHFPKLDGEHGEKNAECFFCFYCFNARQPYGYRLHICGLHLLEQCTLPAGLVPVQMPNGNTALTLTLWFQLLLRRTFRLCARAVYKPLLTSASDHTSVNQVVNYGNNLPDLSIILQTRLH